MGYDVTRFVPETVEADQLACPICLEIFDHPVEVSAALFIIIVLRERFLAASRVSACFLPELYSEMAPWEARMPPRSHPREILRLYPSTPQQRSPH